MQEVDITPQLLKQFSDEFCRVPNVHIEGGNGIPFTLLVLTSWLTELVETGNSGMFTTFQAWLCGRNEFLHPDTEWSGEAMAKILADTLKDAMETDDGS